MTRKDLKKKKNPHSKNDLCRKDLGPAFDQLNFSQVLLWDQSQAAMRQEGASSDGGKMSRAVGSCDSWLISGTLPMPAP